MPKGAILFDFDGTLVDTRQASWEVFAETNDQFGLGVDSRDAFFGIFENNFHESFDALSDDADHIRRAKEHFMAALKDRYQPSLIPGIVDVVRSLTQSYTLAVVSSNAMPVIRRVLTDAGLATCFSHVFSGDVQPSKSLVIRQFTTDQRYASLRHCSPSYVDSADLTLVPNDATFMVTDTVGDVEEARRVGVRAIGVCWGMHDEARLLAAGAETVMVWPQELIAFFDAASDTVPDSCQVDAAVTATVDPAAHAHSGCPNESCRCGAEALRPRAADVRSQNRLRGRRAATAGIGPAAGSAGVVPVAPIPPKPAIDPELLEALRLTAVR